MAPYLRHNACACCRYSRAGTTMPLSACTGSRINAAKRLVASFCASCSTFPNSTGSVSGRKGPKFSFQNGFDISDNVAQVSP